MKGRFIGGLHNEKKPFRKKDEREKKKDEEKNEEKKKAYIWTWFILIGSSTL